MAIPWIFCSAEWVLSSVYGIATGLSALAMTWFFDKLEAPARKGGSLYAVSISKIFVLLPSLIL